MNFWEYHHFGCVVISNEHILLNSHCLHQWHSNIKENRTDMWLIDSNKQLTWVGISNGALLSIAEHVAVSPFKYAKSSFLSGLLTAGIFAACQISNIFELRREK